MDQLENQKKTEKPNKARKETELETNHEIIEELPQKELEMTGVESNIPEAEEDTEETEAEKDESMVTCKEKIFMRKDNYLYFVATDGTPRDEGARQLQEHKNCRI